MFRINLMNETINETMVCVSVCAQSVSCPFVL